MHGAVAFPEHSVKESAVISEKNPSQRTPLRRKICHPNIPSSREAGGDMTLSCAGRLFERAGQRTAEDKREGDKAGK